MELLAAHYCNNRLATRNSISNGSGALNMRLQGLPHSAKSVPIRNVLLRHRFGQQRVELFTGLRDVARNNLSENR
jgi:hypothetical protein